MKYVLSIVDKLTFVGYRADTVKKGKRVRECVLFCQQVYQVFSESLKSELLRTDDKDGIRDTPVGMRSIFSATVF